jgi:hypothetical protein
MSTSTPRTALKAFLPLTPTSPKDASPPSSRPTSLRGMSNESLPPPAFREHRDSTSSDSSVSSDIGENGFLILTPPDKLVGENGLNKITEEEAVE